MPQSSADESTPTPAATERFRHLPDRVALEDTVESVPGDGSADPAAERNAFLDAALQAGG